ncbi:MAG: oligosaccharide flippase family protein, partial [Miltoncostaeaceae bacterium]
MTRGKVARNAISLYGLHGASYLLPLIAFPYLLSILGVSGFGVYGFIIAVARYGILITEWGFNFTASRAISERLVRDEEVGSVYGSTTVARVGLLAAVAAGLGALTLFVPQFRDDAGLFWIAFVGVAGSALFPLWLFQAFQRLPMVISVNVAARAVAVGLLFLLAKDAGDLNIVLWLWSAPWVVTAIAAMILARTSLKVPFVVPGLRGAWSTLVEGRHVFISNAAVTLYTAGNAVLLGILASAEEVGLYVAAETIVTALVGFVGPLGQAVFPRSSEIATR